MSRRSAVVDPHQRIASNGLIVERLDCSTDFKSYYKVSAGRAGGDAVTVRIGGEFNTIICFTCIRHGVEASRTCAHVKAATEVHQEWFSQKEANQ